MTKAWIKFLVIVGVILAGGIFLASHNDKMTYAPALDLETVDLVNFERGRVIKNDPVAAEAQRMINDYSKWLKDHPEDRSKDEALTAYLKLHNRFAGKCNKLGVQVPELEDFEDGKYPQHMQEVRDYLARKGWIASFTAPVLVTTSSGKERRAAIVYLGKLHSHKSGSVKDSEGKSINYTHDVIYDVSWAKVGSFTLTATTEDTHVVQFLDTFLKEAEKIQQACSESDRTNAWSLVQWGKAYKADSSKEFLARVLGDILNVSAEHEYQHVRDSEIVECANNIEDVGAKLLLKAFVESRGLLAGVANSKAPVYAYGHIRNWSEGRDKVHATSGILAESYLGEEIVISEDPLLTRELMNKQGQEAMAEVDNVYRLVVKHKHDINPVVAALKEYETATEKSADTPSPLMN